MRGVRVLIGPDGGPVILDLRGGVVWAAVFAALGQRAVRARLFPGPPVRRAEVADWPRVQDGLFTVAQALQVFDQFVEGVL